MRKRPDDLEKDAQRVRKWNRAHEDEPSARERIAGPHFLFSANLVNKTFCSRFLECGRAGPPPSKRRTTCLSFLP